MYLEIPNFLSPEECDEIIKVAEEMGLETSSTMDQGLLEDEQYFKDDQDSLFEYYDINKDAAMDIDEVSILKYESDSVSDNLYLIYTGLNNYKFLTFWDLKWH